MDKSIIVNGKEVFYEDEKNLLEVIRKAGIELPTFCYHSELSVYGACRMCLVEDDRGRIMAACSTPPRPGMSIKTHTERLIRQRKMTLELLLANHDRECTTCAKSGNCRLQELANSLGIKSVRFGHKNTRLPIDDSSPAIVRDPNKCILCGDCVRMCEEIQGIGVIGFAYRGSAARVAPAFDKNISEVNCVDCGQCAAVCPTGAITISPQIDKVWSAIHDEKKAVIAQVAPAVRVSLGEEFGLAPGSIASGKIVGALKKMGFNMVFDTCFAADLTALEEAHEFECRISKGSGVLPQFTSCCPAWVKYVELNHPDFIENLSSCRSPQQMFGALAKTYYAEKMGIDPKDIVSVSIMPCTAKKFECDRPEMWSSGFKDVDYVLTTREAAGMMKEAGIDLPNLPESEYDDPFGVTTGAAVIFGNTGGVMEAALRTAYELITGKELGNVNIESVRGMEGVREATVMVGDLPVKAAVAHGLANARKVLE
ncbi:MAG: [FeFe] hydrogenase, group A, partial [Firmicutes bacterium]|nr:[FeFe] hydrogenase, group A [Bacillota bacterium]